MMKHPEKLSAKEEAFCKIHKILPEKFQSKRPNLSPLEKSLIKQIYNSYHELTGVFEDVKRFRERTYRNVVTHYNSVEKDFLYTPQMIDFSKDLIEILKEIDQMVQYFRSDYLCELKAHMKQLSTTELVNWISSLKKHEPRKNSVLLLKVKPQNTESQNIFNTSLFAEAINDLKNHKSKHICDVKIDEKTLWLGFIPDLFSEDEIKTLISDFWGSPYNTDVTWI